MTTLPDLLYVAVFALAAPLIDHAVFWPAHQRLSSADPGWARTWLCKWTIASQWTWVVFGVALWASSGRSFTELGLTPPTGWRLWASVALVLLLAVYQGWAFRVLVRSDEQRGRLREQVTALAAVLPHTRAELRWFASLSATAGFCEEFLYRGYVVWVFTPWLGAWGAAALSVPLFALAHLYQGWHGMARTAVAGAGFALIVATFESLWPAIALHALIDLGSGAMAWVALRDKPETTSPLQTNPSSEPHS